MAKIAVNTRLLQSGKLEGIGWFSYESLRRIASDQPGHEFHFLFDRPYSQEFVFAPNVKPVVLFPPARHPFLYYIYFNYSVTRYLNRMGADLFVSPDGFLSGRFLGPQLPVFHDLNFLHRPEFLPWLTRKYYQRFFPAFARMARRIATVSEYSKGDIVRSLDYPAERVDVVYNGVSELFRPVGCRVKAATQAAFADDQPYFVYVGALHKRKNIENMLRAFDLFRQRHAHPYKLLLIGAPMFGSRGPERVWKAMRHKEDVLFLGRQYGETLRNMVASSRALLLVSHFEGFGIPILEAMQCDVPVIASRVTSMPEVAGEAALLTDPSSVEQMAGAMQALASDEPLRQSLIEKGRLQRQRFSWDQTARRLWQSMEKCLFDEGQGSG